VTGGKGQLTVFSNDFFPLATAGPGRGIYTPLAGAIDRNGQLYIAQSAKDGRSNRITVLNGAWIVSREISFDQIPEATGFVPRGLAVSSDGLIYVASQHRGVMVLDNEGNFQRWLQPRDKVKKRASAAATEKPAEKENPPDSAADQPKEDLAEAESAEESGSERGGPPDSEDAAGQRPVRIRAVTIDSVGNIYLVSSETGKIYVYGPDEAFRFSFGTKGGTPGRLSQPRGVAIDRERGLMYVVDYMRHTILTYDKDGTYLFEFGGKGEAPGWFKFPTDVALNKYGQLIVADYFNHRLQVLDVRYQKEFPSLEQLKQALPPAKGPGGAKPSGLETDRSEAGAAAVEEPVPEIPALQTDTEVQEEVIPEELPADPDEKGQ
jgi:DNA-binding beta-propeller fold protein YncE